MLNVYFNHDANTDDFTSLFFLTQMPHVHLSGVSVIPADGYLIPGLSATRKILNRFLSQNPVSVAASDSRAEHPFPSDWRMFSFSADALACLNHADLPAVDVDEQPAHHHLVQVLHAAAEPMTLLFTGPLTDLSRALALDPSIVSKIERLYWMGGTLKERGNVDDYEHDGSAEWNAFWDSQAVKQVFDSSIAITMVSLESTDQVPLTDKIRHHWAMQANPGFDFLAQCYANVPPLRFIENNSTYYFWDVLTTLAMGYPDLVKTKQVKVTVSTQYPTHGKISISEHGRIVDVVDQVDQKAFYTCMDDLAKRAK